MHGEDGRAARLVVVGGSGGGGGGQVVRGWRFSSYECGGGRGVGSVCAMPGA